MGSNRINWEIISGNLKEAREQIEEIEKQIKEHSISDEIELQVMLKHAYHHLNFAWNARRVKTEQYKKLTKEEFYNWGQFPKEMH